jgi:hypothetical protein
LSGRVLQGADSGHNAGSNIEAGLPNIIGQGYWIHSRDENNYSGAFYLNKNDSGDYNKNQNVTSSGGEDFSPVHFDASRSSSIYGNSITVQPSALATNFCIKY